MIVALLLASAAPIEIRSTTGLLVFTYGWSAEADAVPALRQRFRAEANRIRTAMLADAREDRDARREMARERGEAFRTEDFNGHQLERSWNTLGQSKRLLSLVASTALYTGGAHPTSSTTALLWDRLRGREITLFSLLRPGQSWTGAIRLPFCTLLDRERAERRGSPVVRGEWPDQCPDLKELTVALEDKDRDARFDHVQVTADVYVAGSYAEGGYGYSLPLTATMIARLRPEYRASFEPQPPVQ